MALVGQPCPPIGGLQFIKGEPFELLGHGGPTIVEFWATWCGPCRVVFPHLSKIAKQYSPKGLKVVGVSLEPASVALRSFVDGQGANMDYAVATDPQGQAQQLMTKAGISGIPAAFVIDAGGVVRHHGHPADPKFEAAVAQVCSSADSSGAGGGGAAAEAPTPPREQEALPLIKSSREELSAMPVKELKRILDERGVRYDDLHEKGELVGRIIERCANTIYYK